MADKVTFDPLTRIITVTEEPDVNGDVAIDVKKDLYSAGKHDWVSTESLRRVRFPITPVGGNPKPGGYLGSSFFLASDWKIKPYNADHRMIVTGNLFSVDGSDPFLDADCGYTVRVAQEVSNIVERELGQLAAINDLIARVQDIQATNNNRIVFANNQIIIYDDDNTTPLRVFDLVFAGGKVTERVPSV